MKITFPHLGNACFAAKAVFDGLGIDFVMPPFSNRAALEIGSKYSPEEICLPFKIMLGNYIQSIERGADTVVLTGSNGPCRFGKYCELQMNLMKEMGYDVEFIVLDYPNAIGKDEFMRRVNRIGSNSSKTSREKMMALLMGHKVINLMDEIETKARHLAGYETNPGECKRLLKECKERALKEDNPSHMIDMLKKYKRDIENVRVDNNKKPVRVAIIGEIYTILEPFANLYIEDKLMEMGVSTRKNLTPSWWVKDAFLSYFKLNSIDMRVASKKYLPLYIGGHGRECVGEAVLACKDGYDGAIQIFPMGCMPEIVSKAILPTVSKDNDFPIMTLVVDEMTGEAGYDTRIEAFADLLERRRGKNVLYGC